MASLVAPAAWFHEPAERSGLSLVAPEGVAVKPGPLKVTCEASFSACALSCLAWPWAWSPLLPVMLPMAVWMWPVAESTYDFKVDELSDMMKLCEDGLGETELCVEQKTGRC